MRPSRLLVLLLVGLLLCGCARRQPGYVYAQPGTAYAQPLAQSAPGMQGGAPAQGGVYVAPAYASAAPGADYATPYTLDSGDRLRISVFGQDGLSNGYIVDAGGNVNLSLIGPVPARGLTTVQLSRAIAERLRQGYVREPYVAVEIEAYRPFFILGEVTAPGQYPYVADMTVETAVAIAGGFSPRAQKDRAQVTRVVNGQAVRSKVPLNFPLRPGDTVSISERWL